MPVRSPYDVLNVSPTASPVVIEAAYRALMKRHHPDQAGAAGDAGIAADLNQAYALLRDPDRRADFDRRAEAERRERAHANQARIAAFAGPSPAVARRANLFGWSGWVVALLICVTWATASQPPRLESGALPPSKGPVIDFDEAARSQPDRSILDAADAPSADLPPPTTIDAPEEAPAVVPEPAPARVPVLPPVARTGAVQPTQATPDAQALARTQPVRVAPQDSRVAPRTQAPRAPATQTARVRQAPAPAAPRRPAPAQPGRDSEFLEREGLIY